MFRRLHFRKKDYPPISLRFNLSIALRRIHLLSIAFGLRLVETVQKDPFTNQAVQFHLRSMRHCPALFVSSSFKEVGYVKIEMKLIEKIQLITLMHFSVLHLRPFPPWSNFAENSASA